MSSFRRTLAGIAMVGQLLLAFGPDAAHRWIAHGGLFSSSNSCACSHHHETTESSPESAAFHEHSHGDHVHGGDVHGDDVHGGLACHTAFESHCQADAWCDSANLTQANAAQSESTAEATDLQWSSYHDEDDCSLCRLFSRPGEVPTLGLFETRIEPTHLRVPVATQFITLHRSLGHDGRGPPALNV